MSKIKIKVLFVLFILFEFEIQAQELHEFYNGARGLSMGGAAIAVTNDETALMVNPAALGKLRDSYRTIFDPEIDGGTNVGTFLQRGPLLEKNILGLKLFPIGGPGSNLRLRPLVLLE